MKLLAVHSCPVWEECDGSRRPGLRFEPRHPPVVGWCNVARIRIGHEVRRFLLVI